MSKGVVVLADLTALFFTRGKYRKNIDYKQVDAWIKKTMGVDALDEESKFFTMYHPNNESQGNFIKFLKDELDWNVVGLKPSEIRPNVDFKQYRFDTLIGFELGTLLSTCKNEVNEIIVVSDSFELSRPMLDLAAFEDFKVNLAFFSDALDGRWWKILHDNNSKINFLDFETMVSTKEEFVAV